MIKFFKANLYNKFIFIIVTFLFFCSSLCVNSFANSGETLSDDVNNSSSLNGSNVSIDSTNASSNIPETYSPACILMDENSGKILYSKNANTKMYPASTTKIMTAILTLENCKLDEVAVASHNAVYSIPVRIYKCQYSRG